MLLQVMAAWGEEGWEVENLEPHLAMGCGAELCQVVWCSRPGEGAA